MHETLAMSTKQYNATHRFARISVRKVRPLLDLIRGKYADDALDILKYLPHRGARMIEQVLKSAMANAEDKGIRNAGDLVVTDARGEGGPMFKRLMPRARGMAYLVRRRSSHIVDRPRGPGRRGGSDCRGGQVMSRVGNRKNSTGKGGPARSIKLIDVIEGDSPKQGALSYGPEGSTDRVSRGHHGRLAEPLVRFQA